MRIIARREHGFLRRIRWAVARRLAVRKARTAARRAGANLPPGHFFPIDILLNGPRRQLVDMARRHGPILAAGSQNRLVYAVIGLEVGRRLLSRHAVDLKPQTIVLDSIVPKGFLRTMEGEDHRRYRPAFVRAFNRADADAANADLAGLINACLAAMHGTLAQDRAFESAALATLLRLVLGIPGASPHAAELTAAFSAMGPQGFVWRIGPAQRDGFARVRRSVDRMMAEPPDTAAGLVRASALGRMVEAGAIDDTILGNLVYMVEMGREDMKRLLAWIWHFLSNDPDVLVRAAAAWPADADRTPAEAFVLETLRLEQAEALIRGVRRDFVFDGFLFSAGTIVRVCLWEAHKEPEAFADPYRFDLTRFVRDPGPCYAPFGLDHHRCAASDLVVRIGAVFVEQAAARLGRSRVA